jgi:outer membrane protein OmpA-like peptidoglycan-associated protein
MSPGVSLSRKTDNGWSFPEKLEIEDFYNFSVYVDYFMSADNKVLLLSLQRQHGFGDQDLYVSFFKNGKWAAPVNLGPTVNTPGADFAPFLTADGKTLYFASEGHRGFGSSDIFYSKRLDNTWSNWTQPVNLGPAVNSKGWDAYYSVPDQGNYAFFVSGSGQRSSRDIYKIKLSKQIQSEPVVMVKGKVVNVNTHKPVSASIIFKPDQSPVVQAVAKSNPENGTYNIVLPKGSNHYFQAEVEGYLTMMKSININEASRYTELERDLYLVPLVRGQKIPLNNIFFVRSQDELLPHSYQELDQLVAILKQYSTLEIELGGHTDNLGQPELNFDLSLKRVDAVKEYLVSSGIDSSRLHTKGYGDTQPIARNDREFNRRRNRRVEFTSLSL